MNHVIHVQQELKNGEVLHIARGKHVAMQCHSAEAGNGNGPMILEFLEMEDPFLFIAGDFIVTHGRAGESSWRAEDGDGRVSFQEFKSA